MSMGVYIKGMKMPKPKLAGMVAVYNAYIVVKHNGDAKIVVDNEDKTDSTEYPLVPVPPHGDLVDRTEYLRLQFLCSTGGDRPRSRRYSENVVSFGADASVYPTGGEMSMGVYIKGMKMPTNCIDCPMCYDMMECTVAEPIINFCKEEELKKFDFCTERHPRCPLIKVSEDSEK